MARQQINASMPNIYEPFATTQSGESIFPSDQWRIFLEFLYTALFFEGGDPTVVLLGDGIILGAGTAGNYVAEITGGTGVTVVDGVGEGVITGISIGQPVSSADIPTFAGLSINGLVTVTGTVDGRDLSVDGTKLDGIAAGATANSTDAFLLSRANHTGTQTASTVSDFNAAADARVTAGISTHVAGADPHVQYQKESEKDAANGYAGLNASTRTIKGVDATDDIIVDLATKGLVLKDTQATPHYWRVTVSTLGALTTADLGTVKP